MSRHTALHKVVTQLTALRNLSMPHSYTMLPQEEKGIKTAREEKNIRKEKIKNKRKKNETASQIRRIHFEEESASALQPRRSLSFLPVDSSHHLYHEEE